MIKVVEMIIKVLSSSCSTCIFFLANRFCIIPCTKHQVGLVVKFTYPFLYNVCWAY
jgi:hypothetical protein